MFGNRGRDVQDAKGVRADGLGDALLSDDSLGAVVGGSDDEIEGDEDGGLDEEPWGEKRRVYCRISGCGVQYFEYAGDDMWRCPVCKGQLNSFNLWSA